MRKLFIGLCVVSVALLCGCNGNKAKSASTKEELAAIKKYEEDQKDIEKLNHDYPLVPEDDKIFEYEDQNSALYTELKARYKKDLTQLKQEVESTGAKMVMVILRQPESTKEHAVLNSKYGIPFIEDCCRELNLECNDFSPILNVQDAAKITLAPKDGHWNQKGSELVASLFAPILKKYSDVKSKVTYPNDKRPETFGDLAPHEDRILDGGKDLPYHLVTNGQGLRMNHEVKFPKNKQFVLFMGGSQIYSPFLDNEFIATSILQNQFPDREIMNSGIIAATLDDYLTLWREKAKYCEPDLVIVQTNGGDITDYFFTGRNHVARTHKPYPPSPVEEAFYKKYIAR